MVLVWNGIPQSQAQNKILVGVNGSFNVHNLKVEDGAWRSPLMGSSVGIFGSYALLEKLDVGLEVRYHFAQGASDIQPELLYHSNELGLTQSVLNAKIKSMDLSYTSLEVPVLVGFALLQTDNFGLRIFAGPNIEFALTANTIWNLESDRLGKYNGKRAAIDRLETWTIGAVMGLGAYVDVWKLRLNLDLRHSLAFTGLSNMPQGYKNIYPRNFMANLGVAYIINTNSQNAQEP